MFNLFIDILKRELLGVLGGGGGGGGERDRDREPADTVGAAVAGLHQPERRLHQWREGRKSDAVRGGERDRLRRELSGALLPALPSPEAGLPDTARQEEGRHIELYKAVAPLQRDRSHAEGLHTARLCGRRRHQLAILQGGEPRVNYLIYTPYRLIKAYACS